MTTQPILPTARGRLIPATRADLDALWAIWREPEVRRYLFDDKEVSRERAAEVLDACLAQGAHGRGLWTIHVEDERTLVGCAGLMPVSVAEYDPALDGLVEPIVALAPSWWGRGHAVEALRILVDYAFGALALERLAGAHEHAVRRLVRHVGRADYTAAELAAWSPESGLDPARWRERFARTRPWVAVADGEPVGFIEFGADGHIDCCYAHRAWQRRGVGTALMAQALALAQAAGTDRLFAEVSITAVPFFTRHGFVLGVARRVERQGQTLRNFSMERPLRTEDLRMPSRAAFRQAIERHSLDELIALFAEDAVLHSPITFQPFEGKAAIRMLLAIIMEVFQDFHYTDELDGADGNTKILVFRTRVKNRDVEGIDLLRFDDAGFVRDLTVMVRPRSSMETLLGEVQPRLMAAMQAASPG